MTYPPDCIGVEAGLLIALLDAVEPVVKSQTLIDAISRTRSFIAGDESARRAIELSVAMNAESFDVKVARAEAAYCDAMGYIQGGGMKQHKAIAAALRAAGIEGVL